ncbi:MAG: type I-C CRISPR-associated protein Cas8c/Csd1 [Blautia sp.]|nr:type I-C CRISPR-associated protein Cas8c/Csd1 [Blautia sp.]
MGLLQMAYETYDKAEKDYAGIIRSDMREPLAPISHAIATAGVEITINQDGYFVNADIVDKENAKTIIPVTEESVGRTSGACAHPLCDQIGYLDPRNSEKNNLYMDQLKRWLESEYTHPMLMPVYTYVSRGSVVNDLLKSGCVKPGEIEGTVKDEKVFIRWRVIGIGDESGACWTNRNLQKAFSAWYVSTLDKSDKVICSITGKETLPAKQHIKGIVALNGNAKLISANDRTNYTYRGRFLDDSEAVSIGYIASQKAHNTLKWLIANQGVPYGGRTFVCWNPDMRPLPKPTGLMGPPTGKKESDPVFLLSDYKKNLRNALQGWETNLPLGSKAVIASFDAATSGRLSLNYYNELQASDFLERLAWWDETCCWLNGPYGIQSPPLYRIIQFAYGSLRSNQMEVDVKVSRQIMMRLLSCRIDKALMPSDIVKRLIDKCQSQELYPDDKESRYLRSTLIHCSCAVIRKYYIDHFKEEWSMALEPEKRDRSYQYGRLLAIFEKMEKDTYQISEGRETNAIRMQSVFVKKPLYATRIIYEQINRAYAPRLREGQRAYYEKLIGEIMAVISDLPDSDQDKALADSYIIGYCLQKNEFYTSRKKEESNEEE